MSAPHGIHVHHRMHVSICQYGLGSLKARPGMSSVAILKLADVVNKTPAGCQRC